MDAPRTTRALGLPIGVLLAAALGVDRIQSAAFQPAPVPSLARHGGFEENRGQVDAAVRFLSRGHRDTLFLTAGEAVLVPKGGANPVAVRMRLTDANARADLRGVDPLPSLTYYATADSHGQLEAVRTYRRVRYADVYPGIDLEYYRSGHAIEFDVHLAPNADSRRIELTFPGTDRITRDGDGHLILHAAGERVVMKRPLAFQEDDRGRRAVPADYIVSGDRVRFALGDYDHTRALTIDPTIEFATYLGGPGDDEVIDAQLDDQGHLYLFGRTSSGPAFPQSDVVPAQQTIDPINCFVSKLSADGNTLQYSVVFEGFGICEAFEVDGEQVHVAMQSQLGNYGGFAQIRTLDFGVPVAVSPLRHGELSQIDGRPTQIEDIRTDGFGNTYVLYHQLVQGDAELQARLIKVNASGNIVGTHDIGAPSQAAPSARGIAVDNFGRVFVAGSTSGAITPTPDAFQSTRPTLFNCPENGFLIRVDTSVEPWVETYATYIAGNGCDVVTGIVRDPRGAIYLTGRSSSDDLPVIGERWTGGPGGDGVILRFDVSPQGDIAFGAGRFLGLELGSGSEGVHDPRHPIVQLPSGEMALTGGATGASLPLTAPLYDASAAPGFPRFLQVLSPLTLQEIVATHLDSGGAATHAVVAAPRGSGLSVASPHIFAVTQTPEAGLGTGGVQPNPAGGQDILIRRIDLLDVLTNSPPMFELGENRSIEAADASGADFDLHCPACGIVDYDDLVSQMMWTIDGVRYVIDEPFVGQVTLPVGLHHVELVVTDTWGGATVDTMILTVDPPNANRPPVIALGPDQTVTATSPDGIELYLPGMVSDPDNDTLDLTWTVATTTVQSTVTPPYFSGNASALVRLPIGTHVATLSVSDRRGQIVTSTLTIVVNGVNTPAGFAMVVTPADDASVQSSSFTTGRVRVTFENVTAPGLTYLRTRTDQVPPAPATPVPLQPGSAPLYYDLATTASATGAIRVCLDTTGMSFVDRAAALVYRLDGAAWVGVTVPPTPDETSANLLCGQVPANGLGTFATFTPADASTRVTTIIGNGNPFVPGAPAPGDGGPATAAAVGSPRTMVFDPPRQAAYVGDVNRIRRVDLGTNTIATFAGTGTFGNLASEVDGADARAVDISAGPMAVDRSGNLFIPGINGCSILRVDLQTRRIRRVAGLGPAPATLGCGYAGDGGAATQADVTVAGALQFDAEGNLFFLQTVPGAPGTGPGKAVRRIAAGTDHLITGDDAAETIGTVAGGGTQWPPLPGDPRLSLIDGTDLAFNAGGDLYVGGTAFVVRIAPAPGATAIDGSLGELLSVVAGQAIVTGAPYQGDGGPALSANLNGPGGIDILPNGDLLVADSSANRIRLVTAGADGVVNGGSDERIGTVAGFSGQTAAIPFNGDGYALAIAFNYPMDVVVDPRGGFDVVDTGFNRVRHVGALPANQPPVADAGLDRDIPSQGGGSELVHLDGRASADPEGDPLTFVWTENGTVLGTGAEIDVVLAPGPHPITLTVTDTAGHSSSDTAIVTVVLGAIESDISLTVSTPSLVVPGPNDVTLTVTLTNLGPSNAVATHINATLGPGLQFVGDDGAGACAWPAGVCDFGSTGVGASRTVHVVVRPTGVGSFTATFVGSAPLNDPVAANNTGTLTIQAGVFIAETIHVNDAAAATPAVVLAPILEVIHVSDTATSSAAVMLAVQETVHVADTASVGAGGTFVTSGGTEYQAAGADGALLPVHVTFAGVTAPGFLTAQLLAAPPAMPPGYQFVGVVLDVTTTAGYTAPVQVCIDGSFTAADRLLHFENGAWLDITAAGGANATRICGQTPSLSPFAVARPANQPPAADAGVYGPVEATSPTGAIVTLAGIGTDPDPGDVLSFAWTEAGMPLGTTPTLSRVFSLGVHTVTLTVTDAAGASASATAMVTVIDTTPPSVTPPPPLSVPATRAEGTRVSEWPALAAWLAAATAVDIVDATPVRQIATLNGSPIGPDTLLPLGQSTVTFPFRDAGGNLGAATAIVSVAVGTPRIEVRLAGTGPLAGSQRYVDLAFANGGDGIARRATTLVVPVTTRGSGVTRLLTQLPISIGDLVPGQSQTVRVVLQVPSTVREFRLVEAGAFVTVNGRVGGFADSQVVRP